MSDSKRDYYEKFSGQTNADRIRHMSNDELAAFMDDCSDCERCYVYVFCHKNMDLTCKEVWLSWLNSQTENEE